MNFSRTLVLFATLVMTACASTPKPTVVENSDALKTASGSVIGVSETPPSFFHYKSAFGANVLAGQVTKGLAGAVGRGLGNEVYNTAKANKLVKNSNITDPANDMEATLKSYLTRKTGLTAGLDLDYSVGGIEKPKKLPLNKADYILDVTTLKWGLSYFPTSWDSYQTYYTGEITLLDGETGDIVARNVCNYKYPEKAELSPTYETLTKDNAAKFKENMELLSGWCVQSFKSNALKGLN